MMAIELMREDGYDAAKDYIRVGVKSGGCSGLSYDLSFDNEEKENDKVFENNNIKIIVDKKCKKCKKVVALIPAKSGICIPCAGNRS